MWATTNITDMAHEFSTREQAEDHIDNFIDAPIVVSGPDRWWFTAEHAGHCYRVRVYEQERV